MTIQTCPACRQSLPLSQFQKDLRRLSGLQVYCRECRSKKQKAFFKANPARAKEKARTPRNRYANARQLALNDGREFTLEFEAYLALVTQACTYCALPLDETGRGLDRIDNSRGYSADNVVPCCGPCNRARGAFFTIEEMRDVIGPAIAVVKKNRSQSALQAIKQKGEAE